ncbi:uncharacterized protein LOC105697199 [Orussus abietinus]|uniref:uncharacterized protein LOC105697199 n=1 Tax=Orussus abietinus TaxID=222816 RepID=UPI0006269133|nr:uncharacterized protein LOC105697199 [Orussus abietinus]XP_012275727.1 uncharacterized protein LOC105697199 [Orussus abietinus]
MALLRSIGVIINSSLSTISCHGACGTLSRYSHYLCNTLSSTLHLTQCKTSNMVQHNGLLKPVLPLVNSNCGMKIKGKPELRCKDCYFVMRDAKLYVMCRTYPRHKQMRLYPSERKTRILTYACQRPKREW